MSLDIRFTGDLQRLQPQPGDVYVLTLPADIDPLPEVVVNKIRDALSGQIGCPREKVVVLGEGMKLEVMAP